MDMSHPKVERAARSLYSLAAILTTSHEIHPKFHLLWPHTVLWAIKIFIIAGFPFMRTLVKPHLCLLAMERWTEWKTLVVWQQPAMAA